MALRNDLNAQLLKAAETDDLQAIFDALDQNANIETKNINGDTPLILAAYHGHITCVKYLLHHGANIEAHDNYDNTALLCAARKNHADIVKLLLTSDAYIDAHNLAGETALILAAHNGSFESANVLLSNGAQTEAKNQNGETALISAAYHGHDDMVDLLLCSGADIDARDNDGNTPLMCAASAGDLEIVNLLLDYGANATAKNNDGANAAALAIRKNYFEIATVIVDKCYKEIDDNDAAQEEQEEQEDNLITQCNFSETQILGEGTFGKVHLGKYNQQSVAIKLNKPEENKSIESLQKEHQFLYVLKNGPHIIQCHGYISGGFGYGLVLELADDTLKGYLKDNSKDFPLATRLKAALDIANGVNYIHQQGILHRDLKPANILFVNGTAKISDFGLSTFAKKQTDVCTGTVLYSAPEVLSKTGQNSFASDGYSFGIMLWELSTSNPRQRFGRCDDSVHNNKHLADKDDVIEYRITNKQNPLMPVNFNKDYIKFTLQAMNHEPHERPTMQEIATKLEKIIQDEALLEKKTASSSNNN